jgi:hypothetical protein
MPRSSNRKGFALPMAILVIALLTAAIAAGFAATAGEAVVNNAQRAQERAYQLAQAGLEQFLVRRAESGFCSGCPSLTVPGDSEYTRVQLTGGYADVVAKRMRSNISLAEPAIYFIRSKGVDTAALLSGTGVTTFAERTVGVFATWNTTTIKVLGALTTLNGADVTTTGSSSGDVRKENPSSCSSDPDLDNDIVAFTGSGSSGSGISIDQSMVRDTVAARTAINWSSIINGGGLTFDYTLFSNSSWPSSYTSWPVIRVRNIDTLPATVTAGKGIIVADSDFVVPRGVVWDGIILVGGRLTTGIGSSGTDSDLHGAVVTGLNHLLPGSIMPTTDDVIERVEIRYYACYVASAGTRFHAYSVMPNTWMDNVAIW